MDQVSFTGATDWESEWHLHVTPPCDIDKRYSGLSALTYLPFRKWNVMYSFICFFIFYFNESALCNTTTAEDFDD